MSYSVKEVYYTLQGEGARAGRAAVFLRFTGCNLWTGLERDRAKAVCKFGVSAVNVPAMTIKTPIQIHATSGFRKTLMIGKPLSGFFPS